MISILPHSTGKLDPKGMTESLQKGTIRNIQSTSHDAGCIPEGCIGWSIANSARVHRIAYQQFQEEGKVKSKVTNPGRMQKIDKRERNKP